MATAYVRDFRGATNKEARHDGETQLSSAPVTDAMMERFFGCLIRAHQPAMSASGGRISLEEPLAAMVSSAVSEIDVGGTAGVEKAVPSADGLNPAPQNELDEPSSSDESDTPCFTPPSNALADFLVYVFYVFAFITVARPVTLINLKFKDISWPDMNVAENQAFFNRCVPCALSVCSSVGTALESTRAPL